MKNPVMGWRQLCVYLSAGRGWQSGYFIGFFWLHLKIICLDFKKICPLVLVFVLFLLCLLLFLALLENIHFRRFVRNTLNHLDQSMKWSHQFNRLAKNRGGRQKNVWQKVVKEKKKHPYLPLPVFILLLLLFLFAALLPGFLRSSISIFYRAFWSLCGTVGPDWELLAVCKWPDKTTM